MDFSITIRAPEFCDAINNLAAALSGAAVRIDTPTIAKPAKVILASAAPDKAVVTSAQDSAISLTLDQVKTLAATKAKKVGAAVVKAIISDTGAATIADIADPLVLASLVANLEAL